ncbi:2319_t:CDS:1, partial [Scutellospora calospora]
MKHAQKERRTQKNKPSSNSNSEFSKDNPYISNSTENTEKSNDSATPESTSTPPANLNQPSS